MRHFDTSIFFYLRLVPLYKIVTIFDMNMIIISHSPSIEYVSSIRHYLTSSFKSIGASRIFPLVPRASSSICILPRASHSVIFDPISFLRIMKQTIHGIIFQRYHINWSHCYEPMTRTSLKNQPGCSWYSTLYSMIQITHVMFPYHVFLDHTDDRSRCTTFKVKSIMSFGTWKAVCSKYYLCFVRLWKTPLSSISLRHFDTSRIFPRVSHFVRGC